MENKFKPGQVVGCYVDHPTLKPDYGVVVCLPTENYPRYRVRITTESFRRFVEIGILEEDMTPDSREVTHSTIAQVQLEEEVAKVLWRAMLETHLPKEECDSPKQAWEVQALWQRDDCRYMARAVLKKLGR